MCKDGLLKHMETEWEVESFRGLLFGDFMNRETKAYTLVPDTDKFQDVLTEYLEEYNISFPTQMHLVFFRDALFHVSRICRVLRQPRGNALLVGVGGSGRQSLTRLATFLSDFKCYSLEITRGHVRRSMVVDTPVAGHRSHDGGLH